MQAQGSLSQVLLQMEPSFKVAPTAVKTKKVYFASESLAYSQAQEQSKLIRGSSRQPTESIAGTIDVAGSIGTELNATTALVYAAMGDVKITGATVTVGSALTSPTFAYDWTNQIVTVTSTTHGLVTGATVEMIATAPAGLNGTFYFPVIDVPNANSFKMLVPRGNSGTITVTTIKPCTAGTFTYTYSAGGKLPSYIVEKGFPDIGQYFKYAGCTCGKLAFTVNPSGMIDVSTDWMGASETASGTSYETGTAIDNGKVGFDGSMVAAADIKEGGSAIASVKTISFNLDNVLDGDTFVIGGGGVRAGINPGVYQITGSLTAVFEDLTLYTKAKASTESSVDVTFKRGTGGGGHFERGLHLEQYLT